MGYMGSGKSTVGRKLSARLKIPFLDLDEVIESGEGATVPEIFRDRGELYFRRCESRYLTDLMTGDAHFVLATGGGTPCYGTNMRIILDHTQNDFYLRLSVPALTARLLTEKQHRPMVSAIPDSELAEFIGKHLFERNQFYQQAHHIVDCDQKSVGEVVAMITSSLGDQSR